MRRDTCRSCGGRQLQPILSLGEMPLANALLTEDQLAAREPRFPLDLVFCPECSLVQLTETVPPGLLFGEYLYFSSFSDTFVRHAERLARRLIDERQLGPRSLVIEVASNDGYLLQHYRTRRVRVLGIEPAENVARVAREERGIPTLSAFFDECFARRLRDEGRRADVIHAHNVLAHVPDLDGFVEGLKLVLKEDGVLVVEVPYVGQMIERCEFDTIYHEHLCYFSVTALEAIFRRHGLAIQSVEHLGIHGGSLRLFVSTEARQPPAASITETLAAETERGVCHARFYEDFADHAKRLLDELRTQILQFREDGKKIAAYGAAAKGTVLLNALAVERHTISFVADRNPHKQGRYLPGVRTPVRSPQALLDEQPDYVLLLAWNLADEIFAQQAEYRRRGGRFIIPIPSVGVV